ncbi:MAG: hypothetical protein JXR07_16110 [Reichenbachiella sp.]
MKFSKFTFLIVLSTFSLMSIGQDKVDLEKESENTYRRNVEKNISFKKSLEPSKLAYKLLPISDGHFKLIFINRPTEYVRIKIYDIIGNLILSEDNKYALKSEIEYNFNEKNNKIYVVKVEAGEDNLTKKVNF